jgi:hypothetical protein
VTRCFFFVFSARDFFWNFWGRKKKAGNSPAGPPIGDSELIVKYSKSSLCFCKDCGTFCEREWVQHWQLNKHNSLVGISLIGHSGLARLTGFGIHIGVINFIGLHVLISLVGFISRNGLTILIGLISLIALLA